MITLSSLNVEDNLVSVDSVDHSVSRWLPIGFEFSPAMVCVRWMDFGTKELSEPFLRWTIRYLDKMRPPARKRVTDLRTLARAAQRFESVTPVGVILHVSRCGSSLVANVIRARGNVVVLSEACPVSMFFKPAVFSASQFCLEEWVPTRAMFLDYVTRLYANPSDQETRRLVVKCDVVDLLHLPMIRSVWPDTPLLVIIRDPLEVLVSNIEEPPPWTKIRNCPRLASPMLRMGQPDLNGIEIEEYWARSLANLFQSAYDNIDDKCRVIDYSDLTERAICDIGEWFGVPISSSDSKVRHAMRTYSKDVHSRKPFEPDSVEKRLRATSAMKNAVENWARHPYERLRQRAAYITDKA